MQGLNIFELKTLKLQIDGKITAIEHVNAQTILLGDNKGNVYPFDYDKNVGYKMNHSTHFKSISVCKGKEIKQIICLEQLQKLIAIVIVNDCVYICDFSNGTNINFSKVSDKLTVR